MNAILEQLNEIRGLPALEWTARAEKIVEELQKLRPNVSRETLELFCVVYGALSHR